MKKLLMVFAGVMCAMMASIYTVPVALGETLVFDTAEKATNAAMSAEFKPSEEVAAMFGENESAKADYCAKFGFAVVPTSDDKWEVVAGVKEDDWAVVVKTAQAATRQLPVVDIAALELGATESVTVYDCVPGFYYSLYSGSELKRIVANASEEDRNVLCGLSGEVTFPHMTKPSDAAGFYSIGVLPTPDVDAASDRIASNLWVNVTATEESLRNDGRIWVSKKYE